MSFYHDIVQSLSVVDANNAVKMTITSGIVKLAGGVGFSIVSDPDTDEATINADVSAGANDPFYLEKFNKLIGGGCNQDGCASTSSPSSLSPPSYLFSGGPYYIATINNLRPFDTARDRNFALLGGACMQVGDFAETLCGTPDVPALAYPDASPAELKLFNMCTPDVDCEDYRRMFVYLEQIRSNLDGNKDNNLTTGIKLFKQYEAAIHYWNFIVMNKGFTFDMVAGVNQIALTTGFEAVVCGTYTDVNWEISITQVTPLAGIVLAHTPRSHKSSRSVLVPAATGENPMYVLVAGTMKTRDYALLNSVIRLTLPSGSSTSGGSGGGSSVSSSSTSVGSSVSGGSGGSSSDPGTPVEYAVTVTWNNTNIPGGSSLTKNITVMVKQS